MKVTSCPCCNSENLEYIEVLWDELVKEWNLTEAEKEYINFQQGYHCKGCFNNLRTMALAKAISTYFGYKGAFINNIDSGMLSTQKILEINEAGNLTQFLKKVPNHTLLSYPEIDMQDMDIETGSYDVVVHSDTLEHIPNFKVALQECHRILKSKGVMFFTVPILHERLTESRDKKKKVYHGGMETNDEAFVVHTEFGSDVWKFVIEAGFDNCTLYCLEYPSGIVLIATK